MGQWEVPEAAVAQALTEMRSAAAATSSRTSGIVSTHLRAERLRLQRELEAAKADAADAAAKAAKRVAALEADLNEARARSGKAAADAGAGKSKLCTVL